MTRRAQSGFTYIGLLLLLAVLSLASLLTTEVAETATRRAQERELDGIGREFADALRAYGRVTPAGASARPMRLDDLLKDPRVFATRRFLRRIYVDPLTGRAEWGTMVAPGGGIVAVYSLAKQDRLYGDLPAGTAPLSPGGEP